jgi:hypothetical protein
LISFCNLIIGFYTLIKFIIIYRNFLFHFFVIFPNIHLQNPFENIYALLLLIGWQKKLATCSKLVKYVLNEYPYSRQEFKFFTKASNHNFLLFKIIIKVTTSLSIKKIFLRFQKIFHRYHRYIDSYGYHLSWKKSINQNFSINCNKFFECGWLLKAFFRNEKLVFSFSVSIEFQNSLFHGCKMPYNKLTCLGRPTVKPKTETVSRWIMR